MEALKMLHLWKKIITFNLIIALGTLLLGGSLLSQEKPSVKILGIRIEGNVTADPDIIKLTSGLSEGRVITGDVIQSAVKQLWSLGIFSNVQILLDKEVPQGVFLVIKLSEYPRLKEYTLKGNKKLKTKAIKEKIDIYPGQVISPNQILQTKRKILKLYSEKGYLLARVNTKIDTLDHGRKEVVYFNIDEGKRVRIKRITFTGNKFFSEGKLKKQFKKTKEDKWWWFGGDFKEAEYEKDKELLLDFYHKKGFKDAEIVKDSIYYGKKHENMFINITLHEGVRYKIRKITFSGNKLFSDRRLRSLLGFKEGDYYNQEAIKKAISEKLGSLYYNQGYIFAQIVPIEVPVGKNGLNINFQVREGNPVKIRRINIVGNTKTKEKVIRRELRIFPGDTFSRAALMRSQREVFILNYFSNVVPDVKPVDDSHVDLKFKVDEKSTDTANMSAGWSERDRLIGSIGVAMNNLFGNGQHLNFNWTFGRYYRDFQIGFTEPWLLDTPTLAGFNIYDTKREAYYIGYKQMSRGGSFRIGRRLTWPDNYFRWDWVYRIDQTSLSDFSQYIIERNPNGIVTEHWPLTSSSVTQILSRDSRDRPEFPTTGSQMSLSTEVAGGILGGNVGYYKTEFGINWFFPFFWKFVLHSETRMGYMDGFTKASRIPYLDLFFMGGDGLSRSIPLRGYDDPLAGGTVYSSGGRTMFKQSLEIRFPFVQNPTAYGIVFAEAGNIWPSLSNTDPFELRRSVGVGVRVFMPMIGMIGFDYAYGFDNIDKYGNVKGQWKPHFVFGTGF